MRMLKTYLVVVGVALLAFAVSQTVARAASVDEVLDKVLTHETKTFETDMKTTMNARGQAMESSGHMVVQNIIADGKYTGHLVNMTQTTKMPQGEMSTLIVNDGEFVWMQSSNPMTGMMVIKNKSNTPQKQLTGDVVHQLREMYDLKLAGVEQFDGQAMWVLEGTPKEKAADNAGPGARHGGPAFGKAKIYVGQKDFACHRLIGYDKAGAEVTDTQFTNIKVNQPVDPALFKYTPPADARIMDMTKGRPSMEDLKRMMPTKPSRHEDNDGGE